MTLNDYQKKAMETCLPESKNFTYMMLNLVGEVGELASKVGKQVRKENIYIADNDLTVNYYGNDRFFEKDFYTELQKEAGDVLWQLSGLCSVMGWSLEDIASMNLEKLKARKAVGTIDGNGDGINREV